MPLDYKDKEVERLLQQMYRTGFTQSGVNEVYQRLGIANPPTIPASLVGSRPGAGRAAGFIYGADGSNRTRTKEEADFFNLLSRQAIDPYREYGVGNYLGLAGMIVGAAGAAPHIFGGASGATGSAAGSTAAGSTAAGTAAGTTAAGTGTGLGVFANGGAAGLAGVGGGAAGSLAASGAIAGGAGVGGTVAGALGGLSGLANTVSGVGGGRMGWMDWIGPAISAGASLVGGRQANNATAAATRQAIDEQRRQFDTVREDTAPARALGASAINSLGRHYGYNTGADGGAGAPDASAFFTSPDYAFNLADGPRAIDRSAVARGGLLSGAAVKEGQRYASGLASRESSGYLDRLLQMAGVGNTGIGASAAAGANAANDIGAAAINGGNARASTYMNTAANVNNSIQTGISNHMLSRYLNG
jgi:hypothetical protein